MLSSFAASLTQSVKPVTIANYLAAVRNLHLEYGLPDPTANSILLPRVMKGIKRALGTAVTRTRLPLTNALIRKIIDQLLVDKSLLPHDRKMLQAAILLAFYGFLRCSEFAAQDHTGANQPSAATRESVSVVYHHLQPALKFHIKQSKTDPYAKGMDVYIGKATPPYCAVTAMLEYLALSNLSSSACLFHYESGLPLTRCRLTSKVRSLLLQAGVSNANQYAGHSFRIGAATTAAACDIPEWKIRMMGRWQSDSVLRYIRTNPTELTSVSAILARAPI